MLFILPTNMAEALIVVMAIALGYVLPITPVQILWVNMIAAVTLALALAFEPAEADIMQRSPRVAQEPILSAFLLWRVGLVSVLLVAGCFGLFMHAQDTGASLAEARTLAVNALIAGQVVYLFNTRFLYRPSFSWQGLTGNRVVLLTVVLVCVFQLLFTYAPFMQVLFDTKPLDGTDWVHIAIMALAVYVCVELEKALLRRFHARENND
jgi:magnesium-transporting ATPase (P-type)